MVTNIPLFRAQVKINSRSKIAKCLLLNVAPGVGFLTLKKKGLWTDQNMYSHCDFRSKDNFFCSVITFEP